MRITLTLDDDIAAAIEHRRAAKGTRFRDEVNDLLRSGLVASEEQQDPDPYRLPTYDPGRQSIGDNRALADLLNEEDVERALRSGR